VVGRAGPQHQTFDVGSEELVAGRLREAFSQPLSLDAAALFLSDLEAGLDWELATQAVGEGTARRFGSPDIRLRSARAPRRVSSLWAGLATGLLLYLALKPALSLVREATLAAFALALERFAASGVWQPLISALGLDPIYADGAFRSIGALQVIGLSMAAPVGTVLHTVWPSVFLAPDLVRTGAAVSLVAAPGASLLARAASVLGADTLWLSLGLLLTRHVHGRTWVVVFGLLVQAEIVVEHLLNAQVGAAELDASGVPFALALVFPGAAWQATEQLAQLPSQMQGAVLGVAFLALAYAGAFAVLIFAGLAKRVSQRHQHASRTDHRLPRGVLWAATALTLAIVVSPAGELARAAPNWQPVARSMLDQPGPRQTTAVDSLETGPHVVSVVEGPAGAWRYLVDGHPRVVRGFGYNPLYAALPAAERARLYDRDFSAMREMGANTIEGWFENQFDEITLDHAARNGIGVVMPFELNQDWPYENSNVQQSILEHIATYVERYKSHPAVRMWAPGNENLHRVLYRNWVSQDQVPAARVRAAAFAAFLPRLVDRIHELDPDHPVLYRDAEDVYLNWLKPEFQRDGKRRPWFVYGANVYSDIRLEQIAGQWSKHGIGGPLLISEFAPAGQGPDDRALGYRQDWQRIRARPDVVLGGLAYAWATNGPEDLDRVFGLVDASGLPRDGALSALSDAYLADAATPPSSATVLPVPTLGVN
jgi:hypothetical protein